MLVLPFGSYPDLDLHADQRSWLSEGFWYLGDPIHLELVMGVSGGPAISPHSRGFEAVGTYRINTELDLLAHWQEEIESGEVSIFVSDGMPDVVTVPAELEDGVDSEKLERKGLELQTWGDGGSQG